MQTTRKLLALPVRRHLPRRDIPGSWTGVYTAAFRCPSLPLHADEAAHAGVSRLYIASKGRPCAPFPDAVITRAPHKLT